MDSFVATLATWAGALLITAVGWARARADRPADEAREARTRAYVRRIRAGSVRSTGDASESTGVGA